MLINILATIIVTPSIIIFDKFINRLRKSDCCGGHIELDPSRSIRRQVEISDPKDVTLENTIRHLTI